MLSSILLLAWISAAFAAPTFDGNYDSLRRLTTTPVSSVDSYIHIETGDNQDNDGPASPATNHSWPDYDHASSNDDSDEDEEYDHHNGIVPRILFPTASNQNAPNYQNDEVARVLFPTASNHNAPNYQNDEVARVLFPTASNQNAPKHSEIPPANHQRSRWAAEDSDWALRKLDEDYLKQYPVPLPIADVTKMLSEITANNGYPAALPNGHEQTADALPIAPMTFEQLARKIANRRKYKARKALALQNHDIEQNAEARNQPWDAEGLPVDKDLSDVPQN